MKSRTLLLLVLAGIVVFILLGVSLPAAGEGSTYYGDDVIADNYTDPADDGSETWDDIWREDIADTPPIDTPPTDTPPTIEENTISLLGEKTQLEISSRVNKRSSILVDNDGAINIVMNAYLIFPSTWVKYDISRAGAILCLDSAGDLAYYYSPPGESAFGEVERTFYVRGSQWVGPELVITGP